MNGTLRGYVFAVGGLIATVIVAQSIAVQSLFFNDIFASAAVGIMAGFFVVGFFDHLCVHVLKSHLASKRWQYVVAIVSLIGIIVGRLWLGYDSVEYVPDVSPLQLYYAALLLGGLFALTIKNPIAFGGKKEYKWSRIDWLILAVIACIALVNVTVGLNNKNFQNDQFFHVETAQGLLETGQPVRWDFTADTIQTNAEGEPVLYKRAFTYTWQVAQSVQLFGWSEGAARLPSVVWFMLFIVGAYVGARRWSGSSLFAALLVLGFISFDYLLLQSRITRMYSMLVAISAATMYAWYEVYKRSIARKFNLLFVALFVLASLLFINGVFTHFLFFLFGVGFVAFVIVESIAATTAKKESRSITYAWIALMAICGIAATVFVVLVWPFIFTEIGIVSALRRRYELFPFVDLPYQYLAVALYVLGTWNWLRSPHMSRRYIASVGAAILGFFICFVDRYQAMRYVLFAVPLYWTIIFATAYDLYGSLVQRITGGRMTEQMVKVCVGVIMAITVVPVALPLTVSEESVWNTVVRQSRVLDTHSYASGHDFETAYAYIRERMTPGDVVYAQEFRTYYWQNDPELVRVDLLEDKELTLQAFIELYEENGSGWIVWSEKKEHHIKPKVVKYIEEHAQEYSAMVELEHTNMRIFYLQ